MFQRQRGATGGFGVGDVTPGLGRKVTLQAPSRAQGGVGRCRSARYGLQKRPREQLWRLLGSRDSRGHGEGLS